MIKLKNIFVTYFCIVCSILLFFPTYIEAKDLQYNAKVSLDASKLNVGSLDADNLGTVDLGDTKVTIRKYVRHYGSNPDTEWSNKNIRLSDQRVSAAGSYVTTSLVFHKNYGTNYLNAVSDDNTVVQVGYDKSNGVGINTSDDIENISTDSLDFFNRYGITIADTFVKLGQSSNKYTSMGTLYESGDIYITGERIWNNIAISDFTISGQELQGLVAKLLENETELRINNGYKLMVSGTLAVKNTEGKVFENVSTTQELIDIMIPQWNQAYAGGTINSEWTGNDFGYNKKESGRTLKIGNSVVNNFDNHLLFPMINLNRLVYVNHLDILGNQLWGAENSNAEVYDSSGNKKSDLSRENGGAWQEMYSVSKTDTLRVRISDKIKNGEILDSRGNPYKYNSNIKLSYDSNWNKDPTKTESNNNEYRDISKDDTNIVTVDFYYDPGDVVEEREIFVNHLDMSGNKIVGLENSFQTELPSYNKESNLVGTPDLDTKGYMEYYKIFSISKMLLKPSSKLNSSNTVTINGKTYRYDHFNTCSGIDMESALDNTNGARMTNKKGSQYQITHSDKVTIVSFYYKEIGGDDGGEHDDGEYDIKVRGKLAFTSEFGLTGNNSEFIPVNKYLYPYIEGAQSYILPNIDEESFNDSYKGDVVDKTATGKSYWDDYEEYRSVVIEGTSKKR